MPKCSNLANERIIQVFGNVSGTFLTPTCPLFPLISTCISVPFGFHWAVDYCYYVHLCVCVSTCAVCFGFCAIVDCVGDYGSCPVC